MKKPGTMLAFYALELLIGGFVVLTFFALLDDVLTDEIFSTAYNMSGGDADVNATFETFERSWDAFPFIFLGSGFLMLIVIALASGGG